MRRRHALSPAVFEPLEPRRLMTTYFVDAEYAGATSDGRSTATPWRTVAQVEQHAGYRDGDVVRFARGRTWREQLDVPASNLTISSYTPADGDKADPVITGADVIGGPAATNGTTNAWFVDAADSSRYWARVTGRPSVVVRNDVWLNPSTNGYSGISDATPWHFDAALNRLYLKSATDPDATGIEVGRRDRAVVVDGKRDVIVENLRLEKTNSSAAFISAGARVTLRNSTLRLSNSADVGGVAHGGAGVFVNFSDDVLVDRNTVNEMRGEGIYVQGSKRARITNNTVTTVYRGVNPFGDNIQIGGRLANGADQNDGYVISGNAVTQQGTDTPKGCIIAQLGGGGTISNNTASYGNFGIAVGGNDLLVERNTARYQNKSNNTGGTALGVGLLVGGEDTEYADDAVFSNLTFRHNVVHDTHNGLLIGGGPAFVRTGVRVVNNTFYNFSEAGINANTRFAGQVRNNILWGFAPTVTKALRVLDVTDSASSASHNLFGVARSGYVHWDGADYSTAASFAAGTGFTQVSQSDPQFASTDRAAGHFLRLTAASPALDRGTGGFYVAGQLDRAGNAALSGAAVDLGAYELFWTRATRVGRTATRMSASAPDVTFIPTS